jgi:hypothetical protein
VYGVQPSGADKRIFEPARDFLAVHFP